ncbi:receptor-type tyrosine-protein phosphatase T-like isoform X2 [Xenopus laevis]|nr:receptor-type tyrosine-protein phosphatase T-like isoform X2 [Xenopus laevis]
MSPSRLCCLLLLTLAVLGKRDNAVAEDVTSASGIQHVNQTIDGKETEQPKGSEGKDMSSATTGNQYWSQTVNVKDMERSGMSQGTERDPVSAETPSATEIPAQCSLSQINGIYRGVKELYVPEESVTVWCMEGYYPIAKTIKCMRNGTSTTWDNHVPCTEQCKKSLLRMDPNVQLVPDNDYYLPNTEVSVSCKEGYKASPNTITCKSEHDKSVWDVTDIQCVAQCPLSQINGTNRTEGDKEYYDPEESVTVWCMQGYYPKDKTITVKCMRNGPSTTWDNRVPCTEQCKKSLLRMDPNVQLVPDKDYYWPNTEVSVSCKEGYKASPNTITCKSEHEKSVWDVTDIQCVEQCAKPTGSGINSFSLNKDFYDRGESVTVTCAWGYQSVSQTIRCRKNGTHSYWNVSDPCIEQCAKPTGPGINSFSLNKDFYDRGESVTVTCARGYQSVSQPIRCRKNGTHSYWNVSDPCIEKCAKPTGPGINSFSLNKDFYDREEPVTVTCAPRYQSLSQTIRCKNNGTHSYWNVLDPCIAFKVTASVTPTNISLQWECEPGPCQSYWDISVSYWPKGKRKEEKEIQKIIKGVTISELQSYTEYNIIIWGYRGEKRTELERRTIKTEESAPGKPNFTQYPSINDINTLKWRLSETHGVLTKYQLNISAHREYNISFHETQSHWLRPNVSEFNVTLKHGTNYNVTLQGFTSAGPGEPAVWTHETPIAEPLEPQKNEITLDKQTAKFILHPVPNQHGPISSYEIIIGTDWNGNISQSCTSYNSTRYNSSHSLYTALLLPAENVTQSRNLILGDGLHYGSFYNAPLSPDQNYTVYVRVTSTWKKVNKSSCTRFQSFLIAGTLPLPPALIGGLAGAGALLLLLVALLVFCKLGLVRSAKCQSPFGKSNGIPMSKRNDQGKKKRDIPVNDLLEVVKRFRSEELLVSEEGDEENSNMLPVGRPKEFKELPSGPLYPCATASSEQNKTKNRYKKVIPYDNSRVILRSNPSGWDYINASYIDGYKDPKFFIATQGPLPETLADFWHMVWQEKSSVIVMLTGLEEQNKVKCERYWPEEIQTYGDIRVSVESTTQTGAFVTRSFTLQKVGGSAQRTVEQLHYLQWPDHGVPSKSAGLLQLIEQMNKCKLPGSGPVIVHCSAGIGRTGTLLALDILLKRARAEGKVNVYDCTFQMRRRRLNMVQNQGQYLFLYDVLLETIVCGSTSLPIEGVLTHMRQMHTLDPLTNTSGFTREFQAVEKLTELYRICSYREAQKRENHCKNLHPDIIPDDHSRPILMSVMDQHGAPGYINAVFINSNSQEDLFIVTQLPKWETVSDLWSLVWDYRCTSIIVMHPAQDIRELCPHFWPESGESTYSNFRVKKISNLRDSGFSGATLHLQHKKEPNLEVQLWHLDSWPKNKAVPQNPGAIISLIGKVERLQQQDKETHVLVMCGDGATRSGIVCAASVICDQIRSDGFLDVSQSVRSLKKRRRQLIPNV